MSLVHKTKISLQQGKFSYEEIFPVERIMKSWNKLPAEIVMSPTLVIFKITKISLQKYSPSLMQIQLVKC